MLDRKLLNGLAGDVLGVNLSAPIISESSSSHIVSVSPDEIACSNFAGDVYNFAVAEDESYIAGGIVVHNCACVTTPADEDLGDNVSSVDDSEERKTAARGGYSADEFKDKFGFTHPLDEDD